MNLYHKGVLKYTARNALDGIKIDVKYDTEKVSQKTFLLTYEQYKRFKMHGDLKEIAE